MIAIPPLLAVMAAGALTVWLLNKEKEMFDCSKEITNFYNNKVKLSEKNKSEMRERRDANRDRLKSGLEKNGVTHMGMWSQGSYAMHTMVQDENNDYDIDDGVYFKKEDLVNSKNKDKKPYDAKKMVLDAVSRHDLNTEIKNNCVRVNYAKGYHIDIPVYRIVNHGENNQYYELASAEGWKESDPREVTKWFKNTVRNESPDNDNGQQMRRIVRLLKFMVKNNSNSRKKKPSGFLISKLVSEEYEAYEGRDDKSLYYTIKNIHDRLQDDLEVEHPVIDEMLTSGSNDPMAIAFKGQLNTAISHLDVIFEKEDAKDALEAWGNVFQEQEFFCEQADKRQEKDDSDDDDKNENKSENLSSPNIWNKNEDDILPVDKKGGGRNA